MDTHNQHSTTVWERGVPMCMLESLVAMSLLCAAHSHSCALQVDQPRGIGLWLPAAQYCIDINVHDWGGIQVAFHAVQPVKPSISNRLACHHDALMLK